MRPSRLDDSHPHARAVSNLLLTLVEARSVEYKRSASFGDLEPHIVKTSMAMANLRGGGYIIVGVEGTASGLNRTGIADADLDTYDADGVLIAVNRYASPAVAATVGTVRHHNAEYLVIAVSEFDRTPVICSRDGSWLEGKQKAHAGYIYIRPRGFVETRTPKTAPELDEVLDLASEKRAIERVTSRDTLNAAAAAFQITMLPPEHDVSRYDDELGDASEL